MKTAFSSRVISVIVLTFSLITSNLNAETFKGKNVLIGSWQGKEIRYVEGEILVKLKETTSKSQIYRFNKNFKLVEGPNELNWARLNVIDKKTLLGINQLEKSNLFDYVEPAILGKFENPPNDQYFEDHTQWALDHSHPSQPGGANGADINIIRAWDITTSMVPNPVLIAILDTGIPIEGTNLSHPDLDDPDKFILGHDYIEGDEFPNDEDGHGTHVTGIVSAETDNEIGISGICWSNNPNIKTYMVHPVNE
ncbi:S8 family serine peptidase [bacterium]|nr:S8 family serine peptidase [bacterium]